MPIRSKHLAAVAITIWMVIVIFFMILAETPDLEIVFVLTLIGMLVIAELAEPVHIRPRFLGRFRYIIAAGVILFGAIVAQKVLEILSS
ncbi:MAG: Uncharacterized protein XE11_1077 [Methanomicrobiales archaeon 53_19]|jgi:hypothetical protein|uniref:hypothetical protein n=1 Tax=Methanocalculus sp. TaxID=2004547 RepID=UPI0007473C7E|nr:hypothetical protein [Methanocalculus sp.]KUK69330.1 MAG: Uncharacterized protein XD88_1361 [Methanocalculus sp. 52_23]KUL03742.1 MAG: Uncharacterized protein XE11_1077 [Methanomicrobiales archaeon 53_19]